MSESKIKPCERKLPDMITKQLGHADWVLVFKDGEKNVVVSAVDATLVHGILKEATAKMEQVLAPKRN